MKEEIVEKINVLLNPALLKVDSIQAENFKPHPYMIGAKHLEYNDHISLGENDILGMEDRHGPMCAVSGCQARYKEHTYDTVAFILLNRNVTESELRTELMKVVPLCQKNGVDGFGFLETEQKYRVVHDNDSSE